LKWLFRIKLYMVNYRWNGQWYSLALRKIIQLGSNGASEQIVGKGHHAF
jgi:hypothetical protein